jgi:hypothetical protein
MMTRDELNRLNATRREGDPTDEREHFYVCCACGQAVDMRRLGDVFHHEDYGHEPIGAVQ